MTEPIDQATKDLIEKEAISYVIKETGYQILPEHDHWKKAYIAGATNSFKYLEKLLNEKLYKEVESLREQLAKLETQSHDQVRIIEHLEGQLKWERNKVIDDVIDYFGEHYSELGDDGSYITWTTFEVQKKLESLKTP